MRRLLPILLPLLLGCGPTTGSIGAVLSKHNATGQVTIREVPPNMEAESAGLQPGDRILLIDGRDVRPMNAERVHEALVGPIGSTVALTVERDGRILRLDVKRGRLRGGTNRPK
jgi:C-terminal processing protease CtpA/Prc